MIDIAPTVYDLVGIEFPDKVKGHEQRPLEGVSFAAVLKDAGAATGKESQFYSMLGTRGVWSKGWHASAVHAPTPSGWSHFDEDNWELYHLDVDRNQTHDLAAHEPEKLKELKALWLELAGRFNGLPLDDRNHQELLSVKRPSLGGDQTRMTLYPGMVEVPEHSAIVDIVGRSFTIAAELDVQDTAAEGVIYSLGARFGGHALYLKDRRLTYVYNWLGELEQKLVSDRELPQGESVVAVRFQIDGRADDGAPAGPATLLIGDDQVAQARIKIQPGYFSLAGEGACAGRDTGQPVSSDYEPPFAFRGGTIKQVIVDVSEETVRDVERELAAALARD